MKTQKGKRRSPTSKNAYCRDMVQQAVDNQIPFRFMLFDVWFVCAETMLFIKHQAQTELICALKTNCKVALSAEDKLRGRCVRVDTLEWEENAGREIYLEALHSALTALRELNPVQSAM